MRIPVLLLLVTGTLAGCLDDAGTDAVDTSGADRLYTGIAGELLAPPQFSQFGDTVTAEMAGGGQGIWVHQGILFWTNGADLWTADVRDPENVVVLGNLTEVGARDVDVLEWQGRTYALLAGSGRGVHVVDATDPRDLVLVGSVELPSAGVHNLAAVPGTPYVYGSGASGDVKRVDVLDITDPFEPVVHSFPIPALVGTTPVESDGCHDITVRADLKRAYCAGGGGKYFGLGGETFIWDITDPLAPEWLAAIDDPRIKYHHQAFASGDGTKLIINDEYVGPLLDRLVPGSPGIGANNCIHADVPGVQSEDQVPIAAAWIYDVTDEANPVQMSYVQNPTGWDGDGAPAPTEGNCGAHFGDIIAGNDAFVMGWYQGGTVLVDFSDPAVPVVLDVAAAEGSTWDSMYYDGYVFHASGDLLATRLV